MNVYPYVDMTRANADGSYPVYLIIKNSRGRFFLHTGLKTLGRLEGRLFPKNDKNAKAKNSVLTRYLADAERVCLEAEAGTDISNKELKARLQAEVMGVKPKPKADGLTVRIAAFADTKRDSTRVLYDITKRKVEAFDVKATLDGVDDTWLERFRQWCIDGGMSVNGAAKELRNLRAVFNWARRHGMTQNYPFLDYHIVEAETTPRNISVRQLRQLRDYPCEPWQEKYRDFFMLSFYLAGINPVDLLTLKSDAVRDGHLTFVRRKTDKQGQKRQRTITLPVLPEAKEILLRYKSSEGWLLSFMDGRQDYHSFLKKANEALKKIGTKEKVADKTGKLRKIEYHPLLADITMYTARYTFGSIAANDLDISERTIAMCLGHSWTEHVTSRYISSDQKKIDEAVKRVVAYVAKG